MLLLYILVFWPWGMWILAPQLGFKPVPPPPAPALEGEVLTSGPAGKSQAVVLKILVFCKTWPLSESQPLQLVPKQGNNVLQQRTASVELGVMPWCLLEVLEEDFDHLWNFHLMLELETWNYHCVWLKLSKIGLSLHLGSCYLLSVFIYLFFTFYLRMCFNCVKNCSLWGSNNGAEKRNKSSSFFCLGMTSLELLCTLPCLCFENQAITLEVKVSILRCL